MNFIRRFMNSSTTDEVCSIQQGKFFLTRSPNSPKGSLECLYNDAIITIKKTTRSFNYQLIVTKIYQEGESNLNQHEYDSDEDDEADDGTLNPNTRDEWSFAIMDTLNFNVVQKKDGSYAINWNDINGDVGDRFEFIVDEEIKINEINNFKLTLFKCLYESKYLKSCQDIDDLKEFETSGSVFTIDDVKNDILKYNNNSFKYEDDSDADYEDYQPPKKTFTFLEETTPVGSAIYSDRAEIRLYDSATSVFKLLDTGDVKILKLDKWKYSLYVSNGSTIKFETFLNSNMNPLFDSEFKSFVFSHFKTVEKQIETTTWLIKFDTNEQLDQFQVGVVKAMWESINNKSLDNSDDSEYLADSLNAMNIEDDDEFNTADEHESETEDEDDEEPERRIKASYDYGDEDEQPFSDSQPNSNLNVGYANDRSYVVRGNHLGVFKTTDDNLEFQTTISGLHDLNGQKIEPKKLMLQNRDQNMILKTDDDSKLYRMDLNRGEIVEQWDVTNEGIVNFQPNKKLDPLTIETTFSGISSNSIFNLDPRLKSVVVNDNMKQYKTKKNGFNHLITTESGQLAIGSSTGDIRLYDSIGKNAKSHLPSLGDETKGMDVSKDGRWLLITYENYLLLVDCKIGKGQKHEGKLGFERSFDANAKPTPRRLQLSPEHAGYIMNSNNVQSLNFTPAYFNTGVDSKEQNIITSSGNYLISWNLRHFLQGKQPSYLVKRYDQNIVSNKFKFGSNNDIIVALENDVGVIKRMQFRKFKPDSV